MLSHFFRIFARTIRSRSLYSIVGLIGISFCVLTTSIIYLFIKHELSFDRFHKNASSIYRVDSYFHMPELDEPDFTMPNVSAPLVEKIRAEIPGIEHSTRFMKSFAPIAIVHTENEAFAEKLTFVDNDFFRMFSFKMIKGTEQRPFPNNSSVILIESISKKYFGDADPIGKHLIIEENSQKTDYIVSGVITDPPENSSLTFELLAPVESWLYYNDVAESWNEHNYAFFVELKSATDSSTFHLALNKVVSEEQKSIISGRNSYRAKLTLLTEMHWFKAVPWEQTSDIQNVSILIAVGIIVIIIACANFVTLSIVNSSTRTKEIGLKKILGADRLSIVLQFLGESLVVTIIAAMIGLLLSAVLLPYFNSMTGTSVSINFGILDILFFSGVIAVVSVLAGSYPALLFSKYNPSQILKGGAVIRTKSSVVFSLILFQFSLSLFLTGCSFVMVRQMRYINHRDLGFDHEQIIVLPTFTEGQHSKQVVAKFKIEASKEPLIISVSSCSTPFFGGISRMGLGHGTSARVYNVDPDFISTMGIKLEQGRNFNASDSQAVIINKELALGYSDQALGDLLEWGRGQSSEIIGIVKDFNYESLEFPIQPVFFTMSSVMRPPSTLLIKINTQNIEASLARIEAVFKTVNPGKPFQYRFLSDSVNRQYSSYRMWTAVINWANIFMTLIASVGLFGLTGVETIGKYRQIGIRKAFGATTTNIMYSINRRYLWLIGISAILGIPLSYYAMSKWIMKFAYRIDLGWQNYVAVLLTGILVTVAAVGYQTWKAANSNPADTLKHRD